MVTALEILLNFVDADVAYAITPGDYKIMDLAEDYLIWTKGDTIVKDLMTSSPTESQLNAAAEVIDPDDDVTVTLCLLYDDSGPTYKTHKVIGMGLNNRYVFGFKFDGPTASEPQLEAWDNSSHNSSNFHVLGNGTPANSMVKAVCTTASLPGTNWTGSALAGANVLLLNAGAGPIPVLTPGETRELYANIKIIIPAAYATPGAEPFIFTVRYMVN